MPPALAPAPALPDELLEEIFLRLPPDEPVWLARASLANKLWLGRLSSPRFHGRYRELHGAPPMLGFFYCRSRYSSELKDETEPIFISTTKFVASISEQGWMSFGCDALDCRHGRVLLGDKVGVPTAMLTVSDPMTGCWWDLGAPMFLVDSYGAAVLCSVTGCDHRACHDGPFRVVFVGLDNDMHGDGTVASVWVSSPETGECSEPSSDFHAGDWSETCSGFHIEDHPFIEATCPVLVQDALHFLLMYSVDDDRAGILKYDLSSNSLSLIDPPVDIVDTVGATILMAMEDGSLGFAYVDRLTLCMWSRQLGFDGVASWTEYKVINLKELLPIPNPENGLTLIGSVAGRDIIFVTTDLGICEINLKTLRWKKLWKREEILTLLPYMSFYNPEGISISQFFCDLGTTF
jgi:hypothetical protein